MLQFDLQFYEELTVAWVRTVRFISGAFFWPTGQLVFLFFLFFSFFFLCAHEHIYFMECALSHNVLLTWLMVHFVTRMYYY